MLYRYNVMYIGLYIFWQVGVLITISRTSCLFLWSFFRVFKSLVYTLSHQNQVYKNHRDSTFQKLRISQESRWGSIFRHSKETSFQISQNVQSCNDFFLSKTLFRSNMCKTLFGKFNKVIEWKFKRNYLILIKKSVYLREQENFNEPLQFLAEILGKIDPFKFR